jgi:hypothetical protein
MYIITRFRAYNELQTVYSLQLFVLPLLVCQASTLPCVLVTNLNVVIQSLTNLLILSDLCICGRSKGNKIALPVCEALQVSHYCLYVSIK